MTVTTITETLALNQPPGDPLPRRLFGRRRPSLFVIFNVALLGIFIVGLLFPILRSLTTVFFHDGHLDLSAFGEFAANKTAVQSIGTTVLVVVCAAVVSTVVGTLLAYMNERTDARMGLLTDILPYIPLLMPAIAGSYGWVLTLAPRIGYANAAWFQLFGVQGPFNVYSIPALIFVYSIYGTTFAFLISSAALKNLDPSLEEQSRISGASRGRTMFHVVFRSLAPSIFSALLLVIWTGFSNLAVPNAIAQPAGIPIMSVQIYRFLTYDFPPQYGPALVLSMIMVGMIGAVWLVAVQVRKLGRHATVGGKGRVAPRTKLGVWRWPVRALVILYIVVVVLVPLFSLAMVTFSGYWTGKLQFENFTTQYLFGLFDPDQPVFAALTSSISAALIVATVGIFIAAIISVFITSRRSRLLTTADGFFKLPTILPGLVLAIGFLLAYGGAPFFLGGTFAILILAFMLEQVPKGTLTTDSVAAQVGPELSEASRISGANGFRTLFRVHLPLMGPGMVFGWALLFVHVLGDVEVSSIVAGATNPTIGAAILALGENGEYAAIAALAMVVVVISTIVVTGVFIISGRRARDFGPLTT